MSYTHLTQNERYVISHLKCAGFSLREIARRINRHHATISREFKRNGPEHDCTIYWYDWTHPKALERRHKARHHRRSSHQSLVDYVKRKLKDDWSPEVIAEKLKADYPDDDKMRVSHEAIYRWIYLDAEGGGTLYNHLRRRRKKRRRQKRYGSGRRFIPDRVSITERPGIVDSRERFGDWEGDTIEGKKSTGYIATHVERKSRYLMASKLVNKKAESLTMQSIKLFWRIPKKMRQPLTVDNGKEFSRFKEIENKTGLTVYFADPYAAWQRGTNENTNGLLRQYVPKGTDFRKITEEYLAFAVKKLNHRPRKCLNYRSPHQVFWQTSNGAVTT
ncbi:MAG: IS30 family transposase [Deltaproteobacteria bacterium]|nr:IS30 family transposase [Deltaproteobacteria bacterium]